MKILTALIATYWSVMFVAYLFGLYEPDAVIVGFALFFVAADFVMIALNENKEARE